ncbi:MAG: AAA family ATPase [Simkaniaceae bacterium]|nr:MAG: AAA family ATPase [Simkaniaceae bacterium]
MSKVDELSGNPLVKKHLAKLLEKTPHCLLFEGPKGAGKGAFAETFARELLKTTKKDPPDLRILYPEGKGNHHPIHSIKQFIEETQLPPFEASRKVFIIHEADRMLPTSSNALLKTLEEPVSEVTIILLSSHVEALIPTVVSRCFRISFEKQEDFEEGELSEQMFHIGFRLLRKDLPTSKELPEITDPEKALSYLFCFYRDLHLIQAKGDPSLLFYKGKEEILSSIKTPAPSLDSIKEKIEKHLRATSLHIPLGHALVDFI